VAWIDPGRCNGLCVAGLALWVGGRVWGILGAINTAKDHNEKIQVDPELRLLPLPDGISLSLKFRF